MHLQSWQADPIYRALILALSERAGEVSWPGFAPADWDKFLAYADQEGVAPLLFWKLRQQGLTPAEFPPFARLSQAYYGSAAFNGLLYQELPRLLAAFEQAGVPVLVLKGAALAQSLYPDPALRFMTDLDLLVPMKDLSQAIRASQSCGYRRQKTTYHVVLSGGSPARLTVELHWSLIPGFQSLRSPSAQWFWSQAQPFSFPAGQGQMLSPTANLLYLAAHAQYQHSGEKARLIWFYDIHLLLAECGAEIDWDSLLHQAEQMGWVPALHRTLHTTTELFNSPVPAGFLQTLDQACPDSGEVLGQISSNQATYDVWILEALSSLDWNNRIRALTSLFFPDREYMQARYPCRLSWAWPVFYPYRWLSLLAGGAATLGKLARAGR